MQSIINFLSSIATGISNVIDFFFLLIKDLVSIIGLLVKIPSYLPQFFSWIPGSLLAYLALFLSIIIIYKIMGRD